MTGPHIGHSFDMDLIFYFQKVKHVSSEIKRTPHNSPPADMPLFQLIQWFLNGSKPYPFPTGYSEVLSVPCHLCLWSECLCKVLATSSLLWHLSVSHLAGLVASSENIFISPFPRKFISVSYFYRVLQNTWLEQIPSDIHLAESYRREQSNCGKIW